MKDKDQTMQSPQEKGQVSRANAQAALESLSKDAQRLLAKLHRGSEWRHKDDPLRCELQRAGWLRSAPTPMDPKGDVWTWNLTDRALETTMALWGCPWST